MGGGSSTVRFLSCSAGDIGQRQLGVRALPLGSLTPAKEKWEAGSLLLGERALELQFDLIHGP